MINQLNNNKMKNATLNLFDGRELLSLVPSLAAIDFMTNQEIIKIVEKWYSENWDDRYAKTFGEERDENPVSIYAVRVCNVSFPDVAYNSKKMEICFATLATDETKMGAVKGKKGETLPKLKAGIFTFSFQFKESKTSIFNQCINTLDYWAPIQYFVENSDDVIYGKKTIDKINSNQVVSQK